MKFLVQQKWHYTWIIGIRDSVPTVKCKSCGIMELRSWDTLVVMWIGPYTTYQCPMNLDYEYRLHSLTSLLYSLSVQHLAVLSVKIVHGQKKWLKKKIQLNLHFSLWTTKMQAFYGPASSFAWANDRYSISSVPEIEKLACFIRHTHTDV